MTFDNESYANLLSSKSDIDLAKVIEAYPIDIYLISNPSEKLQLLAVQNDVTAYLYIVKPTKKVQLLKKLKNEI